MTLKKILNKFHEIRDKFDIRNDEQKDVLDACTVKDKIWL